MSEYLHDATLIWESNSDVTGAEKWADRKKKQTTTQILPSHLFPVSLFFSCLEKQNKQELTDDPLLRIYSFCLCTDRSLVYFFSIFMRICKWRCVSFKCRVSHVTRAEGSKGTRGGEAPVPQTTTRREKGEKGGGNPTCPHLLWERAALCIMQTDRWVTFFFFFSFFIN